MRKEQISFITLPDAPGVYIFRGAKRQILYIGKATSLRSRVRSYFGKNLSTTRGSLIVAMIAEAKTVETQETDSVLEALLLESRLIKKHLPIYNTREKDNKSFNYVVITKESFPRVLIVRGRELLTKWDARTITATYGPFSSGKALRDALTIIRKIFPFRDTCTPYTIQKAKTPATKKIRPCFNYHIHLCPGVCTGDIDAHTYARTIRHIRNLFAGRKKTIIDTLTREMKAHASDEQFEKAGILRNKIHSLTHIRETALLGSSLQVSNGSTNERIEAYDVAHMSETNRVGVMTVLQNGEPDKKAYRKFIIKKALPGDTAALTELLERRLQHTDWELPDFIVIDGGIAQRNVALRVLKAHGLTIPVITVIKDSKHRPERLTGTAQLIATYEKEILSANAEAHRFAISFHRTRRARALIPKVS